MIRFPINPKDGLNGHPPRPFITFFGTCFHQPKANPTSLKKLLSLILVLDMLFAG